MSIDVIDTLCSRLISQAKLQEAGFAIVLHGGEPLLLGYDRLRRLVEGLRNELDQERYPISLQTNGSLIDTALLDMFSDAGVSVSISIDGPHGVNDLGRVDRKGESTFISTLNGISVLASHKDSKFLFAGTLTVVQPTSSAKEVYNFLKCLGSPSMDFLFQDGNHDKIPRGKNSFISTEYGDWMCDLFECYVTDKNPVPVRIFDDIIRIILGQPSTKEGIGVDSYGILIVESDGELRKNDTLRSSFDGADFFNTRWNVSTTEISEVLGSYEFNCYSRMQTPTSAECIKCPHLYVCGGGMPLYRWSDARGYDSPSVYCRDHIKIINKISEALIKEGCFAKC
jgi:uncharacterized protein